MVILRRVTLERLRYATLRNLDASHLSIIQEMATNVHSYIYLGCEWDLSAGWRGSRLPTPNLLSLRYKKQL